MIQIQTFLDNSHKYVDADGYPYLSFESVFRSSVKGFDTKVLLYPLEEQLDCPAAAIQFCHRQRWQSEVVGEEDESFAGRWVEVTNAAKFFGIILSWIEALQQNSLIALGTSPISNR